VTATTTFGISEIGTETMEIVSPMAIAWTKNNDIDTSTIAYDASETPSPRSRRSFHTWGQVTIWPSATLVQPLSSPRCMTVPFPGSRD
jgi:hypothetical protein